VLFLDHHPEGIGNLESPFVIDFRGIIAPQDGVWLHFSPQKSTAILEKPIGNVNRKR